MTSPFNGFPPDLFTFLSDLSRNNNREWFNDHKDRYQESIVRPMSLFISNFSERLDCYAPHFIADPRPHNGSMFRIYRDTRFSKNKRPYKENVGCQFRHRLGRGAHAPGFYLHLEPTQVFFGGGIWKPDGPSLAKIRAAIAADHSRWKQITTQHTFKNHFNDLLGESLKRPPRGYAVDHPAINDLKRKSFYAMQQVNPEQALQPMFINVVDQAFKSVSPLMQFLSDALDLPY